MKQNNKSYWVLVALGALLLGIQIMATLSVHHSSDAFFEARGVTTELAAEIDEIFLHVREHFSISPESRGEDSMLPRLNAVEHRVSTILKEGPEGTLYPKPLTGGEGRPLMEGVRDALSELRLQLQGWSEKTDPPHTWSKSDSNGFRTALASVRRLEDHLIGGYAIYHDLHKRLELASIVMIVVALVAGFVVIRRNDRVQGRLLKRIATDEKDLRTTLNSIADGVVAMDSEGCVIRMNAVAERLTGIPLEDARGLKTEVVFPLIEKQEKQRLSTQIIESIKEHKSAPLHSGRLKSKAGEVHNVEYRTSQIHDDDGTPLGAVLVFRHLDGELELRRRLEDQEARYKAIVESSPIGMYLYELMEDDRLVMRAVNPAASELVGADQVSHIGDTLEESFPPLRETEVPEAYRRVARTGETWHTDQITYEDNDIFGAFEVRAFQIAPNWMVAAFSNITKRKQAEAKLAKSEAMFRRLFETMKQGIVYYDADGQILRSNPAAQRIMGLDPDELCNMSIHSPVWEAIDENGDPLTTESLPVVRAIKTKQAVTDVLMGVVNQKDRFYRWLNVTAIPEFREGEDTPHQVYTMIQNVTARMRALEELRRLRNLLANIINSMPSVIIGVDTDCKVTHWNTQAERITGVKIGDALGKPAKTLYQPLVAYVEKAANAMELGKVVEEPNLVSDASGNVRYEDVTIYPLGSAGIDGAVIRIDDVTEQRQLVEQLRQSQKMDAVGQLAGGVAHDFNNMLGGILGAAELLEDMVDEEGRQFVDLIVDSAERAAELTRNLLTFSRKGRVESKVLDVHDAIESSANLLEHTLDKRIEIKTRLEATTWFVEGDSGQLQNALINMGINAGHAMPEGGTLTFATTLASLTETECSASGFDMTPGKFLKISVEDTGCGMVPEVADRIFEPFFTTREQGEGTGLGLSAVYGTVQQHHGAITVATAVDQGTTFTLLLPLSKKDVPETAQATQSQPTEKTGTILVVDDEDVIRTTVSAILEATGHTVVAVPDGRSAIESYKANSDDIDLVLLDMLMPEMDGKETFQALKAFDPEVKVIVSSGYSKDADLRDMIKNGMVDFITKPYRAVELTGIIEKYLP